MAFRGTVLQEEWAIDADMWEGMTPLPPMAEEKDQVLVVVRGGGGGGI